MNTVAFGRMSGPSTDVQVEAEFTHAQLEIIKDILAIVNKVANNKENWFIQVNDTIIIPKTGEQQ